MGSAPGPLAVALFNDTGSHSHVGCLAVSQAHRRMLRREGAIVRHAAFFDEWKDLGAAGVATVAEGITRALASDALMTVLGEVDAVVINGEGTIHHDCGRHLLAILGAAQRMGLPTLLVNAVLQDVQDGCDVLAALDDCTVRDARSAAYLASLGIRHRVVVDSIFEAAFSDDPRHDFGGRLVVTDVHPHRRAELAARLQRLRARWGAPVADYALEAPARMHDWVHAVADLRAATAVVTGRHHGVCLALRAGVPFVALPSNTWKVEGFLDLLPGYPAAAADVRRPLEERLDAAIDARDWFLACATRWNAGERLETFAALRALRSRTGRSRVPARVSPLRRSSPLLHAVRAVARPGDGGVLHAGAGQGALVEALRADGLEAGGVDVSAQLAEPIDVCARAAIVTGTPVSLPFPDGHVATVVAGAAWVEHLEPDELDAALRELVRVSSDALVIETTGRPFRHEAAAGAVRSREWWERTLFERGVRRHPRQLATVDYEALEDEPAGACIVLQRLPPAAVAAHPLAALRAERDLHMDMLRESGRRSDAHLARYEWARGWVRPGDVVVDAACGLGYGSAILWDGSEAARVIGLDISASAVRYARDCFTPGRPGIEFREADVEGWDDWADHAVDLVVSFETLEHLRDPARFLAGVRRVLKPGGRLLCSVPNEWVDDTGRDPNPWHLHVFDLDRLVADVSEGLLVDEVHAQSAGGHATRFHPRRRLRSIGWPAPDRGVAAGAEWWLLSAVKDPLTGGDVPYTETVFPPEGAAAPNAIAFARDYVNPWAVYALVIGPYRVRSPHLLTALAQRWLEMSPPCSADAGAALCILAYRALETPRAGEAADLFARVRRYRDAEPANPQVFRWQVSLAFVEGQWHMRRGDLGRAEQCFRECAAMNATAFTPHLETKTTEAAWLAGCLARQRGDGAAAANHWRTAVDALDRLRSATAAEWLISPRRPAAFESGDGLREIAVAVDNAALAAAGLRALPDAGGTWRPGSGRARNFQRTLADLLATVDRRGGQIDALRGQIEALRGQLEAVQARSDAQGPTHAESASQMARVAAERAVLWSRVRRRMTRVVVVGGAEGARRVWEAIVTHGAAEVVAFVDADVRRQGRRALGCDVHGPEWLDARSYDAVALAGEPPVAIARRLAACGVPADRIVGFPLDESDEALARHAAARFPDPLAGHLAGRGRSASRRIGVFGTGAAAMKVWEAVAEIDTVDVAWFADNDRQRHGMTLLWVEVIPPGEIASRPVDAIVIGSMSSGPISGQLLALGIPPEQILMPAVTGPVADLRQELAAMLADFEEVPA